MNYHPASHSFFTQSEELPVEAQIAIRAFPSREAETVGLLNRGEVKEISTRSGNWLQIVGDGGEQDDSWIMWRTETMELLVEISDQHCKNCKPGFVNEEESVATEEPVDESEMEDVTEVEVEETAMDEEMEDSEADSRRPIMPQEMTVTVDTRDATESNLNGAAVIQLNQSMDVDMTADVDEHIEDSAHANGEVSSDSTEGAADDHTADLDEENPIAQDSEPAEMAWDERPIATTKQATFAWDEQPIGTAKQATFNWDEQPVGAVKKAALDWDEQPVGSSKYAWDEQPLDVKNLSNEWGKDAEQEPSEQDSFEPEVPVETDAPHNEEPELPQEETESLIDESDEPVDEEHASEVLETEQIAVDVSDDSKMVEVAEHNNEHSALKPEELDGMASEDVSESLEPDTDATCGMDEDKSGPATTSFAWDERPIRPQKQPDLSEFDESESPTEETGFEAPNECTPYEECPSMDDENTFAAEAIETLSYIDKSAAEENVREPNDEHMKIDDEANDVRSADASAISNEMIFQDVDNSTGNEDDLVSDDEQEELTEAPRDDGADSSVQQYSQVIAVTVKTPSSASWDDRPIRRHNMSTEQEEQRIASSWDDRPIRSAKVINDAVSQDGEALHHVNESEDTFESLTSQNRDSELSDNSEVAILQDEGIMDSGDEDMPLQFDQQHAFADRRMQEPMFPTKHPRYEYFEDVSKSKQQAREEEQAQMPKMDGISFIIRFGIAAYCAHRHSTTVMDDDPFAQLLTDAVILGRNPDAILQALVADEPPWDDWVVYTTPRIISEATREDAQGMVDLLYARGQDSADPALSHSPTIERRKANMERSFKRMSIENTMPRNFNLIMSSTDADVDDILEAEFGVDEVSFDLVYPYKYPVLAGARTPKRSMSVYTSSSTSTEAQQPIRRVSRDIEKQSLATRVPAAAPLEYPAPIQVEYPAPIQVASPAPIQVDEFTPTQAPSPATTARSESPPRMPESPFTSPAPKSNPLKRAAAAIAKTPPVIPPKPVAATSAVSATKTLKRSTSMVPPTSRVAGVKPPTASPSPSTKSVSSTPAVQRSSSMSLRAPTSIGGGLKTPSRLEAPTPTRRLTMAGGSLPTRSSLPSPKPTESLLQRRSLLQAPSPSKLPTPGSSTSSLPTTPSTPARSMSVSGSRMPEPQSRRLTFGFGARPKSAIPPSRK